VRNNRRRRKKEINQSEMKILVTGAKGFVGKNLCAALKNIRDGKDRRFPDLTIGEIYEYDLNSTPEELDAWCRDCDFVFNLAGVNRPQNQEEFMQGNFGFASTLLDTLKKHGNKCPVMLSSSQQASLTGRFGNSEYGRSKKAGEDLFLEYEKNFLLANSQLSTDSKLSTLNSKLRPRVLIYRFPNLFGKWCRPNYNSAVATFCNAFAKDLPYTVNDPSVELELLYIDDLVDEMIACLRGEEHRCEFNGLEVIPTTNLTNDTNKDSSDSCNSCSKQGRYCYCPVTHKITLGEIVDLLKSFAAQPQTLMIPEIPSNSFAKKLYSTYLSYLPKEKVAFPLKMNVDDRGSFTELVHTLNCGQVSINISKPGITKGQHWHNTKWEQFIVVKGHGLIQQRSLNDPEGKVLEWEVNGDKIEAVHMLPGYTHNIINLSDTEDLVTVMYCNEIFNPGKPDTYFEPVK
jgi:UDP-2-acetamido-2,6-beta-L-arabino-hexul-4-ose reductase